MTIALGFLKSTSEPSTQTLIEVQSICTEIPAEVRDGAEKQAREQEAGCNAKDPSQQKFRQAEQRDQEHRCSEEHAAQQEEERAGEDRVFTGEQRDHPFQTIHCQNHLFENFVG